MRARSTRWTRTGTAAALLFLLAVVPTGAASQQIPLSEATISDLNAAFESGALSAEQLVEMYLARIEAYDQRGPSLNTVLWLNEQAVEQARVLDEERRRSGARSLLHGIPVVLKDNVDTADMPRLPDPFSWPGRFRRMTHFSYNSSVRQERSSSPR